MNSSPTTVGGADVRGEGSNSLHHSPGERKRDRQPGSRQADRPTDIRTDGQMDRRTDGETDIILGQAIVQAPRHVARVSPAVRDMILPLLSRYLRRSPSKTRRKGCFRGQASGSQVLVSVPVSIPVSKSVRFLYRFYFHGVWSCRVFRLIFRGLRVLPHAV